MKRMKRLHNIYSFTDENEEVLYPSLGRLKKRERKRLLQQFSSFLNIGGVVIGLSIWALWNHSLSLF